MAYISRAERRRRAELKAAVAREPSNGAAKAARTRKRMKGEEAPPVDSIPGVTKKAGRPSGQAGVVTAKLDAKASLVQAFELLGGISALVEWGKLNPTEFYRIWARLLPKDSNVAVTAMPLEDLLDQLTKADEAGATIDEAARQLGYMPTAGEDGSTLQ